VSLLGWAVALAIVAVGACAQGALGFGLGLVSAPVLALVHDEFVPGPLLMVAFVLTTLVARRERGRLDWRGVKWAVVGRVPGSLLGVAAVVTLPERLLVVVFAALVLTGVVLSAGGWRVEPTPVALFVAGGASGLMGSITSIGGPPMALVYQRRSGPELRATLALFFVFGSVLSIVLLSIAGEIGLRDVGAAAALAPAMLAGYWASRPLGRWLDRGYMRPALLLFSAGASVALLVVELI
jgi:hypothetical protein